MNHRLRPPPSPFFACAATPKRGFVGLTVVCTLLALSACSVTQVTPPAPLQAPAHFKEAQAQDAPPQEPSGAAAGDASLWQHAPATAPVPDAWWQLFADPTLDALEAQVLVGNTTLQSAVAAVANARAVLAASRSAMAPSLSTDFSASRSASPTTGNGTGNLGASAGSIGNPANSVSLTASASWELDLWGRLEQSSRGAAAQLQASADDLAAARLSVQALLAQNYFSLRTAEAQLALLERTVQSYERALALTQARYAQGVAARTDVLQAQTQLHNAQAQHADMVAQRAQLEHALAVLLGQAPAAFELAPTATLPAVPALPPLLPATLLQRRPDIAAAQQRVAAAYAQIGAADAAFFPALTLSADAGFRRSTLANLLSAPARLWSLGPSISQAWLDGGQRKLASAQARATAEQATATYRQTVLTALQEVEDNLVLARQLQQELALQQEALAAARKTLAITLAQYRAGTVGYLNVVTAQTNVFTSETTVLGVQNRQLAAVSQLLKNIAGRWQPVPRACLQDPDLPPRGSEPPINDCMQMPVATKQ